MSAGLDAAIVLCGGKSNRMGRSKAWLPFGDEALLQRVVRRVAEAATTVVVVAAPGQDLPPLPGGTILVRDAAPDRGPLQGIAAGLDALGPDARAAFVSSTDAPFIEPMLIRYLAALREEGDYDAVVPHAEGHLHPLCAVYSRSVRPHVEALLDAGRLRALLLVERVRTLAVDEDRLRTVDPMLLSLRNLNEPADYEAALELLKTDPG